MISAGTSRIDWDAVKQKLVAAQTALEQSSTVSDDRLQAVCRERAMRLADQKTQSHSTKETISVFVFRIGSESYGVELQHVAKVFPNPILTPVPGGPATLAGIANLQGEVRSVLNLRRMLSLPEGDREAKLYVLLLRKGGARIGLLVEQIDDVRHLVRHDVMAVDPNSNERFTRYVQGITHDKLILLNVEPLFESQSPLSRSVATTPRVS